MSSSVICGFFFFFFFFGMPLLDKKKAYPINSDGFPFPVVNHNRRKVFGVRRI